jgi:HSP20 family protein
MRALVPFGGMNLGREMERLFDRFRETPWDPAEVMGEWAPTLDVSETKDAMIVKAELPGMESKDIAISLQGDLLTLKGEKTREKEEKDERYHRVERAYGTFVRAVRLPVTVDGGGVTASFKNGLLTVTLPKSPAAKGTTIPVKAE